MKIEEPEAMKEIREIRKGIWEEIKDMTPSEMVKYFNDSGARYEQESGLKPRKMQSA